MFLFLGPQIIALLYLLEVETIARLPRPHTEGLLEEVECTWLGWSVGVSPRKGAHVISEESKRP